MAQSTVQPDASAVFGSPDKPWRGLGATAASHPRHPRVGAETRTQPWFPVSPDTIATEGDHRGARFSWIVHNDAKSVEQLLGHTEVLSSANLWDMAPVLPSTTCEPHDLRGLRRDSLPGR